MSEAEEFSGKVDRGEIVLWYPQGNPTRKSSLALVQESYGGEMDLSVIGLMSVDSKDAVPHISSPRLRIINGFVGEVAKTLGGWNFRTDEQRAKYWPPEAPVVVAPVLDTASEDPEADVVAEEVDATAESPAPAPKRKR